MFIAFEGPDNVGKSTSATLLAHDGVAHYNVTKSMHALYQQMVHPEPDLIITYDRIDWFTHMVYRLAMPDREWNDERPRTVFTMPDTHLVIKLHHPELAPLIDDELYETGKLAEVNPMYYYFADFLTGLNAQREYALFKTVSLVEVRNDPRDGTFSQRLVDFSSPVISWSAELDDIDSDVRLAALLRHEEQQRL
jgi:hypothetical protein